MDLEAEYNNRARVPEHPAFLARWQRDAAAFRAAHPPETLRYGAGEREVTDLFLPAGIAGPVGALFIHGGYWQALGREWMSHCASGLLARGVAVGVPSYDLCPGVTLDAICRQMEAAAAALARRLGRPVLAAGHSAGGHLAAWLLARSEVVGAALPVSGLFWLEPLVATSINGGLHLDAEASRRLSPALWPAPGKPLHAVVGGEESAEFLRQTEGFAPLWGGTSERIPGAHHFSVLDPWANPSHPLMEVAEKLARGAGDGLTKL
jgi:arylformamidase